MLGTLSETEREKLELKILTDQKFFESILFAEDELMEDFLEQNLTLPEIKAFFRNFLTTPRRLQELKFLHLLKTFARKQVLSKRAM